MIRINLPKDKDKLYKLKAYDEVLYTGILYTARDAAHKRLLELTEKGLELPVDFKDSLIYYAGPTPTKPGEIIGSIGPTTSARMDKFAPLMKKLQLLGVIGKGPRSIDCTKTYQNDHILYFVATGGCGALLSKCVKSAEEIAFKDLGPESIKKLYVEDFPLLVAIDNFNNNIFKEN